MGNPLSDRWDDLGDQWNAWFRSGGGGGGESTEFGGLSAEDEKFKKMLYDRYNALSGQEYESYTGDRFADRTPEEMALIKQGQEGHPMYDAAAKDLGFSKGVFETGAQYDVDQLDADTEALMGGDPYRDVSDRILRDMNRGASMSGMDIRSRGLGAGAAFGDRGDIARGQSNLGYHRQAGDALSKLHYGALRDARGTARQLRQDRETSAGRFGQTALQGLGIGKDKYASRLGSFRGDRAYQDRDLGVAYKDWQDKKNWDWKKLGLGSQLFSGMPIEEKGMTQQPASGGK